MVNIILGLIMPLITASQARTRVTAANAAKVQLTDDQLAAKYSYVFDAISIEADKGNYQLAYNLNEKQFSELKSLLEKNGFRVSQLTNTAVAPLASRVVRSVFSGAANILIDWNLQSTATPVLASTTTLKGVVGGPSRGV